MNNISSPNVHTDWCVMYLCWFSQVLEFVFKPFLNSLLRDLANHEQKHRVHYSWSVTMQLVNCCLYRFLCRTCITPLKCDLIYLKGPRVKSDLNKCVINLGAEKSIWRLFFKDESEFKILFHLLFVSWINDHTSLAFCIFNKQGKRKWVNKNNRVNICTNMSIGNNIAKLHM